MTDHTENKEIIRPEPESESSATRPHRRRRRVNGRLLLVKDSARASARNARPATKYIFAHGTRADRFLTDKLDRRTTVGKRYEALKGALTAHLGGDLTAPQAALVDQAARLAILSDIAWVELNRAGMFDEGGDTRRALDAFLRVSKNHRAVLELLGLERRQKPVPDLKSYLESEYGDAEPD